MKRVLVVSDLHCGSIYGLLPPGFERKDGRGRLFRQRRFLWDAWTQMCKETKGADLVVVNGDLIDGKQQIQQQTELNIATIGEQIEAASGCLREIRPARGARWYFVQGSEYHDQKGCPAVEAVAEKFRAAKPSPGDNPGSGIYSWETLDLEVEPGVVINVQHGVSIGQGFYRATPYDREALYSALAGKAGVSPRADCIVRSHAHFFVHLEHASKHIVGSPCWQLQTRYMRKNSAYRMLPDIGAVVVEVDGSRKKVKQDPIRIHKFLYPAPERRPVRAW